MRLLALDQASYITGYAIFDNEQLITYGKISLTSKDFGNRLVRLRENVLKLINEYRIDQVIIEDIQLQESASNNVATYKVLAEVFGVIQELVSEIKLPFHSVGSGTWRKVVGIKGLKRAERKKLAQDYVENKYNQRPSEDECDAICIGIYYLTEHSKIKEF